MGSSLAKVNTPPWMAKDEKGVVKKPDGIKQEAAMETASNKFPHRHLPTKRRGS